MYIYPEQDRQLESRMREIRTSGSEGGGGREASPYPYPGAADRLYRVATGPPLSVVCTCAWSAGVARANSG